MVLWITITILLLFLLIVIARNEAVYWHRAYKRQDKTISKQQEYIKDLLNRNKELSNEMLLSAIAPFSAYIEYELDGHDIYHTITYLEEDKGKLHITLSNDEGRKVCYIYDKNIDYGTLLELCKKVVCEAKEKL